MKRKKEKKKRKIKHIKECHKLSLRLICLPVSRKRRLSQKNFGKGSSESRRGRCEDDETRSDHLMVEQLIHLVWLNVFQLLHVLIELLHVQALFPQQVVAEECKQEEKN